MAAASLDRWGGAGAGTPLLSSQAQEPPEPDSHVIPICLSGAEGKGRWITLNSVAFATLVGAVALKITNIFVWKSNAISVLSNLAIGASLCTLAKINWITPGEKVLDEFSMFLAPFMFQVITQFELNTSVSLKELWFSLYLIPGAYVLFSHITNVLSAPPGAFGASGSECIRPLIEGDARKFTSAAKILTPLVIVTIALLTLGIWKHSDLLTNVGTYFAAYAGGTVTMLPLIEGIQRLRSNVVANIRGDVVAPTNIPEMICGAYKVIPVVLPFILASLATWNKLPGYALAGLGSGGIRAVRRDFSQRDMEEPTPPLNRSRLVNLADALLPCPNYLLTSAGRESVERRRRYIDTIKSIICIAVLIIINGWAAYWDKNSNTPYLRSQLISAAWSANIFFFISCSVYALCKPGANAIKNSLHFVVDNLESFVGPLYLAFFAAYQSQGAAVASADIFWCILAALLVNAMIKHCKNGQMPILTVALIFYYWLMYTLINSGKLIG